MSSADKLSAVDSGSVDIPLQDASREIWSQKYQLKDRSGKAVDKDVADSLRRVARALADLEATPDLQNHWYQRFLWALQHGAIPAGRIMSNAGAQAYKPATSTINCTVSGRIEDSMDSILS